jgi:hypothetical protein
LRRLVGNFIRHAALRALKPGVVSGVVEPWQQDAVFMSSERILQVMDA